LVVEQCLLRHNGLLHLRLSTQGQIEQVEPVAHIELSHASSDVSGHSSCDLCGDATIQDASALEASAQVSHSLLSNLIRQLRADALEQPPKLTGQLFRRSTTQEEINQIQPTLLCLNLLGLYCLPCLNIQLQQSPFFFSRCGL
jgi:hypothetical protein